jgi:hypothetical protein
LPYVLSYMIGIASADFRRVGNCACLSVSSF